ncbi:MAG: hypothetical protein KAS96_10130 [Planctomycetes bacterium]|nr:hypothetical protein [Planctomycetota bacterium]
MRVRSVTYFENKLNSNNNAKNSGPRNKFEILNAEQADYFAEKNKETKKVA